MKRLPALLLIVLSFAAPDARAESCEFINKPVTPQVIFHGLRCPIVIDGKRGFSFSGEYIRVDLEAARAAERERRLQRLARNAG